MMIDNKTFTAEHIRSIQNRSKRDPSLIERSVFALGLLEAVARSGLPFIFKGGSSLMLLMEKPRRFSTDIDIVVSPGVEIDRYLNKCYLVERKRIRRRSVWMSYQHAARFIILSFSYLKNRYCSVPWQ